MLIIVDNKICKIVTGGADNLIDVNVYEELREFTKVYPNGYQFSKRYNTFKVKCNDCGASYIEHKPVFCKDCRGTELSKDRIWDGEMSFINRKLEFQTGFLKQIHAFLEELGFDIRFEDVRDNSFEKPEEIIEDIGPWHLRDYQSEGVEKTLNNYIGDLYFPRGIINAATNAGKNSYIASIYHSTKVRTLILVHRKELFRQAIKFFESCGIEVSKYGMKDKELGEFTVAMYKTLLANSKKMNEKLYLNSVSILVVDECHNASSKSYRSLIKQVNAFSVIFVSGTPFKEYDDLSNMYTIGQSGSELVRVTNEFLMDRKISQKPQIYFYGYECIPTLEESYGQEVERINYSMNKVQRIKEVCELNKDKQILIVVNHVRHGNFILENLISLDQTVDFVHGGLKDQERFEKLDRFEAGYTNVLISTMILKEGVNLKDIRIWINAAGGESIVTVKQLVGRLIRADEINDTCYVVDFKDKGRNVGQHVKERMKIYKKEKFEIFSKKDPQTFLF